MEKKKIVIRKETQKKLLAIRKAYINWYGKRASLDSLISKRIDHFIGPNRPKLKGEGFGNFIMRAHQCRHYCRGMNHDLSDPKQTRDLILNEETFNRLIRLKEKWSAVHWHEMSFDSVLAGMMHFAWNFKINELFPSESNT